MHKLEKLILESYAQIDEDTIKPKDLPAAFKAAIEKRHGPLHKHDFFTDDMTRYMKFDGEDKRTGQISHKVIAIPSFDKMYSDYSDIVQDIKVLMRDKDVRTDKAARELFELIKTNFRKLQRYLRIERPDQYALIRSRATLESLHESFQIHASIILEEKKYMKTLLKEANTPRYPEGKLSFADKVKAIVPLWKQWQSASGRDADAIKDKISRYTAYDNEHGGGSYALAIVDDAQSVEDVAKIIKREEDRLKKDGNEESDYTVKLLVPKVYFNVESGELSGNKNEWYTDAELKAGADQTSYTKGSELDDIVFSGDYDQALDFAKRYTNLIKVVKSSLNESLLDEIEDEEPTPEEEPDTTAPEDTVLEDATDKILGRFPTVKAAIVKLQTEQFKEFVESIDWISPRPSSFRINLKNGQDYILKWTGKTFEAQILGKKYLLSNIAEYQQALDKLAILYKEAPMTGAGDGEPVDTDTGGGGGGGGEFPGEEGGAEGGEDFEADDAGGEEGGGADLGGEEIDFEEPAEEPEA